MLTTLRVEVRLDGALNFKPWKARIFNLLEENDLDDYVTRVIPNPMMTMGKQNTRRIKPR